MNSTIWSKSDKILSDVKKLLGPGDEYDAFDRDIVMHINAGFARLCTLGVGPEKPFHIETGDETWEDFDTDADLFQLQRFFYLFVKTIFDPASNGTVVQAHKDELDKMEWLLNSISEVGY